MLIEQILNLCCEHYGVTPAQLKSSKRTGNVVLPRHVAMYVMWQCGRFTQEEIAKQFMRDHATVHHAVENISHKLRSDRWIKADPELIKTIKYLSEVVKSMLTQDLSDAKLDMPGYQGLMCVPRYALRLSSNENAWLHWMWMSRGDIHQFNGGWLVNSRMYYEAWKRGDYSTGSNRLCSIFERTQATHPYILIVPLSKEVACPTQMTGCLASSSEEKAPAKSGS